MKLKYLALLCVILMSSGIVSLAGASETKSLKQKPVIGEFLVSSQAGKFKANKAMNAQLYPLLQNMLEKCSIIERETVPYMLQGNYLEYADVSSRILSFYVPIPGARMESDLEKKEVTVGMVSIYADDINFGRAVVYPKTVRDDRYETRNKMPGYVIACSPARVQRLICSRPLAKIFKTRTCYVYQEKLRKEHEKRKQFNDWETNIIGGDSENTEDGSEEEMKIKIPDKEESIDEGEAPDPFDNAVVGEEDETVNRLPLIFPEGQDPKGLDPAEQREVQNGILIVQ